MKKLILIICIALMFISAQVPKELTVTGPEQEWQRVIYIMDKSQAPHTDVESAKKFLLDQLIKQAQDTTKRK